MARTSTRSGRTLTVFFLALAVAYGLVALAGTWKPELGLDLQGGTRITLQATGNPSSENLNEARDIINQRVNGSGITEAEVTTQGGNIITVEIPGGGNRRDLVDVVKRQAQLRFRLVACDGSTACGTGSVDTSGLNGIDLGTATGSPDAETSPDAGTEQPSGSPSAAQRAPLGFGAKADGKKAGEKQGKAGNKAADASATPTDAAATETPSDAATDPSTDATDAATPSESPTSSSSEAPKGSDETRFDDAVSFMNSPPADWTQKYNDYTCPTTTAEIKDDPDQPLVTCDPDGLTKYLLTPAIIEGTDLTDASFGIPQNEAQYVVTLDFNKHGRGIFADATGLIASTGQRFAIVLDGQVISAPTAEARISNGAQISGDFTQAEAKNLATSLKYGSLPIAFEKDVTSEVVGPTLAGNQLHAGMLAGLIGLILVIAYCMVYYRGLGLVVVASFAVAAAWIYALVLLLSKTAGFTLTLPGIAGLIIAVGVTADSFIIFFERIRDEMRDGKSMRVAVESGWVRARQTRVAANVVQLLSALILYVFATGVVKGFGFALGLTTLIDLAVLFWFTKPLVTNLARFRFFNGGGKLSGLSVETLGVEPAVSRVGGKA